MLLDLAVEVLSFVAFGKLFHHDWVRLDCGWVKPKPSFSRRGVWRRRVMISWAKRAGWSVRSNGV